MITRFPDWVPRLRAAVLEQWEREWQWGKFDCCAGPCGLVEAITGVNLMGQLLTYTTEIGSLRVLRRWAPSGTADNKLLEAGAERLCGEHGLPEVAVLRAHRGSLVLITAETATGPADVLACVDLSGERVITANADGGWLSFPITAVRRAWQV